MKYGIRNRYTRIVQFTADIEATECTPEPWKVRLAAEWAIANCADLTGANLTGADLTGVDLTGVDLRHADLTGANLTGANLTGANLTDADLTGASLAGANLTGADLAWTDLTWATLTGANLTGAALRYAPTIPHIHRRVYKAASAPDALDMSEWHTCDTTHCRAGWVVTLAGEAGRVLERETGTAAAAALIYMASDPTFEHVPDFYCTNEDALADMKRLAEAEAAREAAS